MAFSTCCSCGIVFSGIGSFDKHRTGSYGEAVCVKGVAHYRHERRCRSIEEMLAKGMRKSKLGYWTSGGDFDMSKAFSKREEVQV